MNANESINKSEFVGMLCLKYPAKSERECKEAFEMVIDVMTYILGHGSGINFSGFGTFEVHDIKARKGRHPATGEIIDVKGYKQVGFRMSGKIKDRLNGNS